MGTVADVGTRACPLLRGALRNVLLSVYLYVPAWPRVHHPSHSIIVWLFHIYSPSTVSLVAGFVNLFASSRLLLFFICFPPPLRCPFRLI